MDHVLIGLLVTTHSIVRLAPHLKGYAGGVGPHQFPAAPSPPSTSISAECDGSTSGATTHVHWADEWESLAFENMQVRGLTSAVALAVAVLWQ